MANRKKKKKTFSGFTAQKRENKYKRNMTSRGKAEIYASHLCIGIFRFNKVIIDKIKNCS